MDEQTLYRRRRRIVAVVSVVLLLALMIAGTLLIGKPLLQFMDDPAGFRSWAEKTPWGRLILAGIMALQVVISLIPGGVVEIAAGTCYGGFVGGLLCLAGAAVGSSLVFLLVRRFGLPLVEAFVSREKIASLSFLQNTDRVYGLLFLLYLIPGTPKDVFNYVVGLLPINLRSFLLLSTLARAPAIFATTFCGDALIAGDYLQAGLVFAATMFCSLAGILFYRWLVKRKAS